MIKKIPSVLLSLLCCASVMSTISVRSVRSVYADAQEIYYEDTFDDDYLSNYTLFKNADSSVDIVNGALQIVNVNATETTKIKLPVGLNNFVMDFSYTILEEEKITDAKLAIIDAGLSVLYRYSNDENGYETTIHSTQKDGELTTTGEWSIQNYGSGPNIKVQGQAMPNETSGHGIENWIYSNHTKRLLTFNYYYAPLEKSQTYNLRLQVSGRLVELYIDNDKFLCDILDEQTSFEDLYLQISGKTTVAIDNLCVYSPVAYAERLIEDLPVIKAEQSETQVNAYLKALNNVHDFALRFIGNDALINLSNYETYKTANDNLISFYGNILSQKPILTVAWKNVTYEQQSTITLPIATGVAANGKNLFVNTKVQFDGKTLECVQNTFQANEAGKYTITYWIHDEQGNETKEEYSLYVVDTMSNSSKMEKSVEKTSEYLSFGISFGVLAIAVVLKTSLLS